MSTLLITGGAGYIGSHAVKLLMQKGHRCVVVDNLSFGHRAAVSGADFEQVDTRSFDALNGVFDRYDIDAVMHFAALTDVAESVKSPEKYHENNVVGTTNLIKSMLTHGVKKLVFSSSCTVYGTVTTVPVDETHDCAPISPYGHTKRAAELLMEKYRRTDGLQYIALRYFNASGAAPDGNIGESHTPETHLIPLVLQAISGKRDHITLFGQDYPTPDGTCVRDYVHVDDLADAHVQALAHLDTFSGCLNIGTGEGHSVRQVIAACEEVTGKKCPVINGPRRDGDAPEVYADAGLAKKILKWTPKYTSLKKIVETAWKWEQNRRY